MSVPEVPMYVHKRIRASEILGDRLRAAEPSQCARGLIQGDRATQSGAFKAFKGQAAASAHELGGKRLGLLGFGRIARVLTQREESAST